MKQDTNQLITDFIDAAKKYDEFTMTGDWKRINTQAKKIDIIFRKITKVGKEARELLLAQVDNNELSVSIMAAAFSLKYNPQRSIATLKRISKEPGIDGFEARQVLQRWKEGSWKLE